jgi:hypothetical protein
MQCTLAGPPKYSILAGRLVSDAPRPHRLASIYNLNIIEPILNYIIINKILLITMAAMQGGRV